MCSVNLTEYFKTDETFALKGSKYNRYKQKSVTKLNFEFQGLQPYSPYMARGNYLLNSLKGGSYSKTDVFMEFAPLSYNDRADLVVITNK